MSNQIGPISLFVSEVGVYDLSKVIFVRWEDRRVDDVDTKVLRVTFAGEPTKYNDLNKPINPGITFMTKGQEFLQAWIDYHELLHSRK